MGGFFIWRDTCFKRGGGQFCRRLHSRRSFSLLGIWGLVFAGLLLENEEAAQS